MPKIYRGSRGGKYYLKRSKNRYYRVYVTKSIRKNRINREDRVWEEVELPPVDEALLNRVEKEYSASLRRLEAIKAEYEWALNKWNNAPPGPQTMEWYNQKENLLQDLARTDKEVKKIAEKMVDLRYRRVRQRQKEREAEQEKEYQLKMAGY